MRSKSNNGVSAAVVAAAAATTAAHFCTGVPGEPLDDQGLQVDVLKFSTAGVRVGSTKA